MQSLNGSGLENLVRKARDLADEIRFIELMPISVAAGLHRHEYLSAARAVSELERTFGPAEPRPASGTAQNYTIQVDGHPLGMGIIPSVSEPFCSACDRLRLDSRGKLFACLRHPDWLDLGTPLRQGQAALVRERVAQVLDAKCAPEFIWPGREMSSIGG
jgi:cyclic pyranopterin phosphate synthase